MQYRFKSLQSLADKFGNDAALARANADRFKPTQKAHAKWIERAATLESVADMLRTTALTGDDAGRVQP